MKIINPYDGILINFEGHIVDKKFLEIKEQYFKSSEIEGEDYKWKSLRNEDIEYLFSLIENKE